jgi:hypothetical protein
VIGCAKKSRAQDFLHLTHSANTATALFAHIVTFLIVTEPSIQLGISSSPNEFQVVIIYALLPTEIPISAG